MLQEFGLSSFCAFQHKSLCADTNAECISKFLILSLFWLTAHVQIYKVQIYKLK